MTFLNPAFFYLFLLSIPITLLYLFRLRRRRVQVSTLMFWEQILRDAETAALLHRLKRWVSLLCQIAFLALVALAATRPLLPGYEQARRRLIALVDISASMNAMDVQGGRIQAARDIALSLVDRLGPADEMMLIAVDDAPHILVPFTDDPKLLRSAIKAIQAGQARTDFTAAVNLALRLPSNGFKKEVYLVSDGNFPTVQAKPPDGVAIFHAAVGRSDNNLAITTCEARTLATSPRDYEVLLTAQNSSDRERKVNVELYLDDRLADVRPLSLRPQEVRAETFAGIRLAGSRITAVLDAADDLPLDNKAYAVLPRLDPLKVLLVTQGNPFLEAALASDEALEATATLPATYHAAEGYDVVIFDGWSPDRVDRGKFVFINSDMKALALGNSGQVAAAALTDWDPAHPLLRHANLANVSLARARRFAPRALTVVARSFDDPLIFAGQKDAVRYVSFAFDVNDSDLPLRAAFPILVSNALRWLTERDLLGYSPSVRVGASRGASVAGFHTLRDGAGTKDIAVNLCDSRESDIKPRDRVTIGGVDAQPLPPQRGLRFDPWFYLVCLALAFTACEWVLYHRRIIE